MRTELLMERESLKQQIRTCVVNFMNETDKEKALEILTTMKDLSKRVEQINCKLAHRQLRKMFKKEGKS